MMRVSIFVLLIFINFSATAMPRDPFEPVTVPEKEPIPLSQFQIRQLKLRGILLDPRNPKALFEDPQGFFHTLEKGALVGKAKEVILDIQEDKVVLQTKDGKKRIINLRNIP